MIAITQPGREYATGSFDLPTYRLWAYRSSSELSRDVSHEGESNTWPTEYFVNLYSPSLYHLSYHESHILYCIIFK